MNTKNLFLECLNDVPKDVSIEVDLSFDIASRIDALLVEKGLSQKEFADMMGKRESEVSKWLKGTHNFTLRTLAKISAVLDSPIVQVVAKQPNVYTQQSYSVNVNLLITPSRPAYSYHRISNGTMGYGNYTQMPD
ncbi:MAG: helix-turn-helix transcriptional regulator [Alistipes sp.]|nr:helix-turn-helix transcriptional regulator [Alistipes sp.]